MLAMYSLKAQTTSTVKMPIGIIYLLLISLMDSWMQNILLVYFLARITLSYEQSH